MARKKVALGVGLICVPVVAGLAFLKMGVFPVKLFGFTVVVGLYGAYLVLKGTIMFLAPKSEPGDVSSQQGTSFIMSEARAHPATAAGVRPSPAAASHESRSTHKLMAGSRFPRFCARGRAHSGGTAKNQKARSCERAFVWIQQSWIVNPSFSGGRGFLLRLGRGRGFGGC